MATLPRRRRMRSAIQAIGGSTAGAASEARLDPGRRRRQAGAGVAARSRRSDRRARAASAPTRSHSSTSCPASSCSGRRSRRQAPSGVNSMPSTVDAPSGASMTNGLRLLAAHDQRRAALDAAVADDAVACIEVHDELQQAGREDALARMGGAAGEVPEALDRVAQVGRPPLDRRPAAQLAVDAMGQVRHSVHATCPGRSGALGCASRAPACMVSALERVKSGVHTGSHGGDGPMSHAHATTVVRGFGQTERRDTWWATPLAVFLGFSTFIVYATWAAFQGEHYTFGPYLSPFYSPELFGDSPHAWFGPSRAGGRRSCPFSPALLILPVPGGFRFTCYYYRGAYYKAFWADPPACAVGEPRKGYRGENTLPADPPERPPLLPLPRARGSSSSWPTTPGRRCGSPIARRRRRTSASASARSCSPPTSCCSAATRSAATRCATSSAAAATCSSSKPVRQTALRLRRARSTAGTCSGPGAACSRSASPTSTSGSARWACWTDWRLF